MHSVQISDTIKALIDQLVADGRVENEARFLEEAALRYASDLQDEDEAAVLLSEAEKGIADIEAGRYVTIAGPADVEALRQRVRDRAEQILSDRRRS